MHLLDYTLSWVQNHVPVVVALVLLLAVGWLLARLTRSGIERAASLVGAGGDGAWPRFFRLAGRISFWTILAAFTLAALQLARSAQSLGWIDRLGEFVPRLLGGAAILVGGALLSVLVRDLAVRSLSQFGMEQAKTFARVLQLIVLVTAFVVGVDQLGIRTAFLVTMIAILAGGAVFAVGLAFGLGAGGLARNLIGARDARRYYVAGQRVRIGDTEGELLEIAPTVIVLATPIGRVTLPARVFHESAVTLVDAQKPHG